MRRFPDESALTYTARQAEGTVSQVLKSTTAHACFFSFYQIAIGYLLGLRQPVR